jgi:hypothetical protein
LFFPFQAVVQGGDDLRIDGAPQFEDTTSDDDDEDYMPSWVNTRRVPTKSAHANILCSHNLVYNLTEV